MTAVLFTDPWTVRGSESTAVPVRLPHDAIISEAQPADATAGGHGGRNPGGAYIYASGGGPSAARATYCGRALAILRGTCRPGTANLALPSEPASQHDTELNPAGKAPA